MGGKDASETSRYEMVVGLEVHCQLATKSKLFCGCPRDAFGAAPNSFICPVCTGQPGVLPVLNRAAVELAFKAALALDCRPADVSVFARKNYFYPDLPKAYQVSQYEEPFSTAGRLEIHPKDGPAKTVGITRIHLEEDAGKLLHAAGSKKLDHTLVDLNRSGTPLIEIVSEPDIRSPEEAYAALTALKEIIQYAGISRCDMEKGEMRCDANVSVRLKGAKEFGTRAEIKNLNSFRWVKEALGYEFRRQVEIVDSGNRVAQETRLWDTGSRTTEAMRSKEEAHDYRYFPDPDLVPLACDAHWLSRLKADLAELPAVRRKRFESQYGLSDYDASVLTTQQALGDYFETAAKHVGVKSIKTLANLITTELMSKLNAEYLSADESKVSPQSLGKMAVLLEKGVLSSKLLKEVFANVWETGKDPEAVVSKLGLSQVSDEGQVLEWVKQALAANAKAADDLRNGKERAIGAIVGGVMKLSQGKANPALVNKLIKKAVGLS